MRRSRRDRFQLQSGRVITPSARRLLAAPSMALAYALMIAAVNLLNPLLPVIQDDFRLGAAEAAAIYSVYLFVLVAVLAVLAKVRPAYSPRAQVLVALVCALLADVMHTLGSVWALGLGRALLSLSIGISTGAVAEHMVATVGERGRTTTATANIAGAFLGTGGAGLVVLSSNDPMTQAFSLHAAALVAVTLMIWLFVAPVTTGTPRTPRSTIADAPYRRSSRNLLLSGFLMGCLAWVSAASLIVLAPAAYASHGGELGAGVTVLILGMFASAFVSQYTIGRSPRRFGASAVALVVGMGVLAVAAAQVHRELLFAGGVLVGIGYGAIFRMGMAKVSRGLDEKKQSSQASRYAGIGYLSSSVSLVGGGVLVDRFGGGSAMAVLAMIVGLGMWLCHLLDRLGSEPG